MKISNTSWIFLYAILLHLVWGVVLLFGASPLGITGIASLVRIGFVSASSASYLYLVVAVLAATGLCAPKPAGFFFLLPQQIVLILSAFGAVEAMVLGTFADGTVRDHAFLVADQAPSVIAATLHTLAVWINFLKPLKDYDVS